MRDLIEQKLVERGIAYEPCADDWAFLKIPKKHDEVGDLKVGGGQGELIVAVGPGHAHSHFDQFSVPERIPESELSEAIAEAAADHIAAMIADQVVIEIVEEEGRAEEVRTYRLPRAKPLRRKPRAGVTVRRYVWSGPYGGNGS